MQQGKQQYREREEQRQRDQYARMVKIAQDKGEAGTC